MIFLCFRFIILLFSLMAQVEIGILDWGGGECSKFLSPIHFPKKQSIFSCSIIEILILESGPGWELFSTPSVHSTYHLFCKSEFENLGLWTFIAGIKEKYNPSHDGFCKGLSDNYFFFFCFTVLLYFFYRYNYFF